MRIAAVLLTAAEGTTADSHAFIACQRDFGAPGVAGRVEGNADDLIGHVPQDMTLTLADIAAVSAERTIYHAQFAIVFARREPRAWAVVYSQELPAADMSRDTTSRWWRCVWWEREQRPSVLGWCRIISLHGRRCMECTLA